MSEEKARRPSWAKLDEQDKRDRTRLRRQMQRELLALLTNTDGIQRLRAISDDDWARAAQESDSAP